MMATTIQATTVARHPFLDFNDAADHFLPRHDKDEIRTRLLDQLESVLLYLFPRGKRRGSQFYIGNLQGDPGDSLVVELEGPKRGLWIDFATGESGDVLALWASSRGYRLPADFSDLLDDAGDWLMVPRIASAPLMRTTTTTAYDDLGPHTGKWDYHAADGSLLACVYRHDTPTGKQYRPWDVRARAMRMPEPRPLYNLPAIAAADAVVLVEGVFPQAQAALIAAAGGVGKSFLLLALAREVAAFDGIWVNAPTLFGGALTGHGVAVYITAEDDAIEVHNRLNALGPIPERLYVLPLPDAGGSVPLFAPDPATRGPATTAAWMDLERQLKAMPGLCLVVLDPLQPLCALDLNVPENAQFVCSRLAALAASTGASVIVSHHFAKREASTPEQAREAIRGTGGLVDGVRAVYALWHPKEDQAKKLCEALGEPFERGRVVMGGVVKANGRANLRVTTFLRSTSGLLVDGSDRLRQTRPEPDDLLPALKSAIARAARDGQPYTKTGGNGLYERRHELPEAFHAIGKHRLSGWVDALLAQGELITAMAEGSKLVKWLDVPDGPVAQGQAVFVTGHLTRSSAGRPVVE